MEVTEPSPVRQEALSEAAGEAGGIRPRHEIFDAGEAPDRDRFWKHYSGQVDGFQSRIANGFEEAITGTYPHYEITYTLVSYSHGPLPDFQNW